MILPNQIYVTVLYAYISVVSTTPCTVISTIFPNASLVSGLEEVNNIYFPLKQELLLHTK